jgi:hypothetical protein
MCVSSFELYDFITVEFEWLGGRLGPSDSLHPFCLQKKLVRLAPELVRLAAAC